MSVELKEAAQQVLKELGEARKIIRASSSRQLAKDWDRRATDALANLRTAIQQPATDEPVVDVRCEGCGYMTHHREHMGCVRAAKQHTDPATNVPDAVEDNIVGEHYFTAEQGVEAVEGDGSFHPNKVTPHWEALSLLTFCVLVLKNGFTVTGESTCASLENFDAEMDRKIARRNAVDKVWSLMGYALKERMASSDA